ncbi:MAG: hypothetical protein FJW34_02650 [Acidobacteria bacterium]|nr:hypothetical protein [Acidobacteriota bacterium]
MFDEEFLQAARRVVGGAEVIEEAGEILFVLGREESGAGTEAVFEGVLAGDGFSGGGSGPGAAAGVAAVGVDLFFGGHKKAKCGRTKPNWAVAAREAVLR